MSEDTFSARLFRYLYNEGKWTEDGHPIKHSAEGLRRALNVDPDELQKELNRLHRMGHINGYNIDGFVKERETKIVSGNLFDDLEIVRREKRRGVRPTLNSAVRDDPFDSRLGGTRQRSGKNRPRA